MERVSLGAIVGRGERKLRDVGTVRVRDRNNGGKGESTSSFSKDGNGSDYFMR